MNDVTNTATSSIKNSIGTLEASIPSDIFSMFSKFRFKNNLCIKATIKSAP